MAGMAMVGTMLAVVLVAMVVKTADASEIRTVVGGGAAAVVTAAATVGVEAGRRGGGEVGRRGGGEAVSGAADLPLCPQHPMWR